MLDNPQDFTLDFVYPICRIDIRVRVQYQTLHLPSMLSQKYDKELARHMLVN